MKYIVILFTCAAQLLASSLYTVTDLGGLGGSSAAAYKINNAGLVVGWAQTPSNDQHAFMSGLVSLQDLSSSAYKASANGVNNSGTVVGTVYVGGDAHGTIWNSGGGVTDLGVGTFATGINDAGVVIGSNGHAFAMVNGVYRDLGVLPGGDWSSATGINSSGTVVGDSTVAGGNFRAFVSTAGGGMTQLSTLGGNDGHATGINDSGEVIGTASLISGYQHAFSALGAVLTDLGTLGGGSSYAYGINDSGEIVGYSWLSSGGDTHAFLYVDGVMLDLNNVVAPGSGWVFTAAYGINDAGQIVGTGLFNGVSQAFLLNPDQIAVDAPASGSSGPFSPSAVPDPATGTLAGIGLAVIALGLWRRRA